MAKEDTPQAALEQAEREVGNIMLEGLGRAVLAWSFVERASELALTALMLGHGMALDEAHIISTAIDVRDRAALITALSHRAVGNKRWFGELVSVMNRLSNELRNSRNRLFHDAWSQKKGGQLSRRSSKPKLIRPQSRKFELILPTFEPVTIKQIDQFIRDCLDAADQIGTLTDRLADHFDPPSPQK